MHVLLPSRLQGGLIALLLLLLVFTVALYAQRRWQKRRRIPQKSCQHGSHPRDPLHPVRAAGLRRPGKASAPPGCRRITPSSACPFAETPILDDYDYEEEDDGPRRANHAHAGRTQFRSQATHSLDSLGRPGKRRVTSRRKVSLPVTSHLPGGGGGAF